MAVLAMMTQVLVAFEVEAVAKCLWCCYARLSEKNSGADLGVQGCNIPHNPAQKPLTVLDPYIFQ